MDHDTSLPNLIVGWVLGFWPDIRLHFLMFMRLLDGWARDGSAEEIKEKMRCMARTIGQRHARETVEVMEVFTPLGVTTEASRQGVCTNNSSSSFCLQSGHDSVSSFRL